MNVAVVQKFCPHCPSLDAAGKFHTKTCTCTHHHADHNFAGGCKIKNCACDRYDQRDATVKVSVPKKVVATKVSQEDFSELTEKMQQNQKLHSEFVAGQKRVKELKEKREQMEADMSHNTH